jgi:hypothetical protein
MITFTAEHARARAAQFAKTLAEMDAVVQSIVEQIQEVSAKGRQAVAVPMADVAPKGSGAAHHVIAELQGAGYTVKWSATGESLEVYWNRVGAVSVNCVAWPALAMTGLWASMDMADATGFKVFVVYVALVCGGASGLWLLGAGLWVLVRRWIGATVSGGGGVEDAETRSGVGEDGETRRGGDAEKEVRDRVKEHLEELEREVRKAIMAMPGKRMEVGSLAFLLGLDSREMRKLVDLLRGRVWSVGGITYEYLTFRTAKGRCMEMCLIDGPGGVPLKWKDDEAVVDVSGMVGMFLPEKGGRPS